MGRGGIFYVTKELLSIVELEERFVAEPAELVGIFLRREEYSYEADELVSIVERKTGFDRGCNISSCF